MQEVAGPMFAVIRENPVTETIEYRKADGTWSADEREAQKMTWTEVAEKCFVLGCGFARVE